MWRNARLKTKILALLAAMIVGSSAVYLLVVSIQSNSVQNTLVREFRKTAENETRITTTGIYNMCKAYNDSLGDILDGGMELFRLRLRDLGGIELSAASGPVKWRAVNQNSKAVTELALPKVMLGKLWLGQEFSFSKKVPIIDDISRSLNITCTIFQKMDERGDLLRVASTVKTLDGRRAVGTYIPATNADGSLNPIVRSIMAGQDYHGLAKVVDKWCTTYYSPLRDRGGRIIGAIYVGINQDKNPDMAELIKNAKVGKTGYVFVLGANGNRRGHAIIHKAFKDEVNLLDDPAQGPIIRELIDQALKAGSQGTVVRYQWRNKDETKPRDKIANVVYFPPFDWVVGCSAYEDDFREAETKVRDSFSHMVVIFVIAMIVVLIIAWLVSLMFANSLSKALGRAVGIARAVARGDFSQRMNLDTRDEIGQLGAAIDQVPETLNRINAQFVNLEKAAENGELSFRGDVSQFEGAYRQIIEIVNLTLNRISVPIEQAIGVLDRLQVNDITEKVDDTGLKGDYLKIATAVNHVRENLSHILDTVINIADGDLKDLPQYEKVGRRSANDQLIPAFITMLRAITALVDDSERLALAGQEGRLGVRADASVHKGAFKDIVDGINKTLDAVVGPLSEAAGVLRAAAEKDLSGRFSGQCSGDFDELKNNINALMDAMDKALGQVAEAIQQVTAGGDQIADASQSLSQGATEQAASLEEISSSMAQIGSQVTTNAENAGQANRLSSEARQAAERGSDNMEKMVVAMKDISQSSQLIAKVNKVIDDIAFQTNLLALNAAVEAARAGVHGKGFAVVAGEVRNLAGRSAKAAQETAEIIEESCRKVENGLVVAETTRSDFSTIVNGIVQVSELAGEIAVASNEQAQGITQINQGLGQIDQVTQQNTAHAEETAAAAEELSGQANQLQALIRQFRLTSVSLRGESRPVPASAPAPKPVVKPMLSKKPSRSLPEGRDGDWGKARGSGSEDAKNVISFDEDDFGRF